MLRHPALHSAKSHFFARPSVLAALVLALAAFGSASAKDPSTLPALKRVESKSQAVAAKVLGATVGIINQSLANGARMGEGSGVVVSEDGIILTAGHVLGQPGAELTIIFPDGRRASAKALGANFTRDSGAAKITEPGKWPQVEMGHSDDIKPGAWCMALGHPGGVQKGRTPPIRLGRILVASKRAKFLVSDATVISGDSGGPLFDLEGRVIGIHSNIGMGVNQNQHVPIDVYREQWTDLLAGKTFGSPRDVQPLAGAVSPEKLRRFQQLFFQRMLAGDPEAKALMKDGQLHVSAEDIDRLLAKWDQSASSAKAAPAPRPAASEEPLDFLKFQRLFQDRLLAGDPDVLKLVKDGKMLLTPSQMRQLMDQWEKKSQLAGGAKPTTGETARKDAAGKVAGPTKSPEPRVPYQPPKPPKAKAEDLARLRDMMKNAVPLGDGRFSFRATPEGSDNLRGMPGWANFSRALSYGKSSPQMLKDVASIAIPAAKSTVVVLCDGKPTALGTVVRKDGYILTKSSELHGKISCKIGARKLPATFVKMRSEHDLTLLKVNATDLTPINWADGDSPAPGSWLITPSGENDALGLGVVSIATRPIPDFPTMLLRNRAVIGVMLDETVKDAVVRQVGPGLPAAKAGLQAGDVIVKINDQPIQGPKEVNQCLGKYKPGDKITMSITRAGKPRTLKMDLISSDKMAPKANGNNLLRLSEAGGTVSRRHSSFISAFTHDTVIQAADCGGPVVNLDGRAVGLNIARADRTATYALPAKLLCALLPEMLPK